MGVDMCQAKIRKMNHGDRSEYGWEVDHIIPESKGGADAYSNLRPLHWQNNDAKGNHYGWRVVLRQETVNLAPKL